MPCAKCPCPEICLGWDAFCAWAAEEPPDEVKLRHIESRSRIAAGEAPKSYPPLPQQAANLGRALWDWAVSGFSMASDEEQARRLAICGPCEFHDNGRCRHLGCGCYLSAKVQLKTEHCPIAKW